MSAFPFCDTLLRSSVSREQSRALAWSYSTPSIRRLSGIRALICGCVNSCSSFLQSQAATRVLASIDAAQRHRKREVSAVQAVVEKRVKRCEEMVELAKGMGMSGGGGKQEGMREQGTGAERLVGGQRQQVGHQRGGQGEREHHQEHQQQRQQQQQQQQEQGDVTQGSECLVFDSSAGSPSYSQLMADLASLRDSLLADVAALHEAEDAMKVADRARDEANWLLPRVHTVWPHVVASLAKHEPEVRWNEMVRRGCDKGIGSLGYQRIIHPCPIMAQNIPGLCYVPVLLETLCVPFILECLCPVIHLLQSWGTWALFFARCVPFSSLR